MLQKSGYATAHFGKWHLSNNMIPDSPLPGQYGYDEYGAFNCAGEQMPVHEDARNTIAFIEKATLQESRFLSTSGSTNPIPHFTPSLNIAGVSVISMNPTIFMRPFFPMPMTELVKCWIAWTGLS